MLSYKADMADYEVFGHPSGLIGAYESSGWHVCAAMFSELVSIPLLGAFVVVLLFHPVPCLPCSGLFAWGARQLHPRAEENTGGTAASG